MKGYPLAAFLVVQSLLVGAAAADFDTVLRGGKVYDGTGAPFVVTDVAIKGDRIAAVGDLKNATATTVLDVVNLVVAPGFIDGHSHWGDRELLDPELAGVEGLLAQGVTTVFINADGWGLVDLAAQRDLITKARPAVNAAPMIGHKPVRIAVLGMSDRAPSKAEMNEMVRLVRVAFERDGAFGLSTGLLYAPASFAQTEELIALARIAREFGGFYHSHIRDEGPALLDAIDEVITIARTAQLPGIVTHIKASGPAAWGRSSEVIQRIVTARESGLKIWADQYPYEAGMTYLVANVLPGWAQAGGIEQARARLADPATRAKIRAEASANLERIGGAGSVQIGRFAPEPSFAGKRLDVLARERSVEPIDLALTMIEQGEPLGIFFSMRDDDITAFMRQPWTMTASDGGGIASLHPRTFGTFTRKLRTFAIERKVISLERAIHSMTGQPAEVLGLRGRGHLRVGEAADIVVLDPEKLRERSTYERSGLAAEGMVHVFVNGRAAVADGNYTGVRAGQVLARR